MNYSFFGPMLTAGTGSAAAPAPSRTAPQQPAESDFAEWLSAERERMDFLDSPEGSPQRLPEEREGARVDENSRPEASRPDGPEEQQPEDDFHPSDREAVDSRDRERAEAGSPEEAHREEPVHRNEPREASGQDGPSHQEQLAADPESRAERSAAPEDETTQHPAAAERPRPAEVSFWQALMALGTLGRQPGSAGQAGKAHGAQAGTATGGTLSGATAASLAPSASGSGAGAPAGVHNGTEGAGPGAAAAGKTAFQAALTAGRGTAEAAGEAGNQAHTSGTGAAAATQGAHSGTGATAHPFFKALAANAARSQFAATAGEGSGQPGAMSPGQTSPAGVEAADAANRPAGQTGATLSPGAVVAEAANARQGTAETAQGESSKAATQVGELRTGGNESVTPVTPEGVRGAETMAEAPGRQDARSTETARADLYEQVSRALEQARIRASRTGHSEVRIRLEPPELGEIRLRLTLQDGQIHGQILANRPEVKAALEAQKGELWTRLAEQGIEVGQFDVGLAGDQSSGHREAETSRRRPTRRPLPVNTGPEALDAAAIEPVPTPYRTWQGIRRIDYRA